MLKQYLQHYINYAQNNWLVLLLVAQFVYNVTPQKGIRMSPFKVNYRYILRTLLTLRQVKKISTDAKERIKEIIELYKNLKDTAKLVQECIKRYYDRKRSKGPALKRGDKVWLLHKNFKNRQLSKKLNHVKLGPFKITEKISEVIY